MLSSGRARLVSLTICLVVGFKTIVKAEVEVHKLNGQVKVQVPA